MDTALRSRIPVGLLGATGSVGQRFVTLLSRHPWFELVALTASERSAGKSYGEAVAWAQEEPLPERVARMPVLATPMGEGGDALPCRLIFSALGSAAAEQAEAGLACRGHFVVSNAKSHRMDPDVPLVVPEVNPEHLELVRHQPYGDGALVTNPNCSTIGLVMALKPLADAFGLDAVHVVTLQALSGAGIPGVPSMAIVDNVVPHIGGEEDKLETEPRKILGHLAGNSIAAAEITISAQCTRVPVSDGHTECVSLRLREPASAEDIERTLTRFRGEPQELALPSAPAQPVEIVDRPSGPQPRLDRNRGRGMAASVGRIRPCPLLGWKMVVLSHNTLRGAAGGSILVAELAVARGLVPEAVLPR